MHHDNNGEGDNDNKFQTARIFCVELKNGPEHRIHIVALLRRGSGSPSPLVQSYALRNVLCIEIKEFFT